MNPSIDPNDISFNILKGLFGEKWHTFNLNDPSTFSDIFVITNTIIMVIVILLVIKFLLVTTVKAADSGRAFNREINPLFTSVSFILALFLTVPSNNGYSPLMAGILWAQGWSIQVTNEIADASKSIRNNFQINSGSNPLPIDQDMAFGQAVRALTCAKTIKRVGHKTNITYVSKVDTGTFSSYRSIDNYYKINLSLFNGGEPCGHIITSCEVTLNANYKQEAKAINICNNLQNNIKDITYQLAQDTTLNNIASPWVKQTELETMVGRIVEIHNNYKNLDSGTLSQVPTLINDMTNDIFNDTQKLGWITIGAQYLQFGASLNRFYAEITPDYEVKDYDNELLKSALVSKSLGSSALTGLETRNAELDRFVRSHPNSSLATIYGNLPESIDDNVVSESIKKYTTFKIINFLSGNFSLGSTPENKGILAANYNSWEKYDPIYAFTETGQGYMRVGGVVFGLSAGAGIISLASGNIAISVLADLIQEALGAFAKVLFFLGILMAVILPFIPFFFFMMAVVAWVLKLIETILGAHFWALSFAFHDGKDFVSESSKQGFKMLLALLATPPLLVITYTIALFLMKILGFYGGQLFEMFIVYSNETANVDASVSGVVNNYLVPIDNIIQNLSYFTIEVVFIALLVWMSFSMMSNVNDNVLQWLGGSSRYDTGDALGRMSSWLNHAKPGPMGLSKVQNRVQGMRDQSRKTNINKKQTSSIKT